MVILIESNLLHIKVLLEDQVKEMQAVKVIIMLWVK